MLRWTDSAGKRCQRSSGPTDNASARRILDKLVADAALRRERVIDPALDRYATEGRKPLKAHLPTVVTCQTQQLDFLRTGIARREPVTGEDGQIIMLGKGKRRRLKTRIVTPDAEGRVVDLHVVRTTLGTKLARSGVAPPVAMRLLRHSDYRTTLKHYTALLLADTAAVVNGLPSVGRKAETAKSTA